ncbi:MAG: hypothetical protein QXH03_10330 [Candidatus Bathyarchaeia archaeon]
MPIVIPAKVMPGDPIKSATTNAIIDALTALSRMIDLTCILAIPLGPTTISYGERIVYTPFRDSSLGNDPTQVLGWPIPFKARITNLIVHVTSNGLDGNTTVTLYVNESPTVLSLQIGAKATGTFSNQVNEVVAELGSRLTVLVDTMPSSKGQISITGISMACRMEVEE